MSESLWESRIPEIMRLKRAGKTNAQIAEHFGVSKSGYRRAMSELRRQGKLPADFDSVQPVAPQMPNAGRVGIGADGVSYSERPLWMTLDQVKDPDYIMRAHGFPPEEWELVSVDNKIWNTNDKVHGIQTLYASAIKVKPLVKTYTEEDANAFFERFAATYKSPVHVPSNYSPKGKLLQVDLADLHVGKLAWYGDSGDTYNHEIARERFFYIINNVIDRVQRENFEKVLFVWANDFMHFDSPSKTTTADTPQDASTQFEHMYELACEMLTQGIDLLSEIAPLTTMYMASNHDRLVSYFATRELRAWYRNNPYITVDARPLARKAVRFGANLIGFTHGHLEKKQMWSWMSVEYRKDWGETVFHECHCHHIHSEKAIEEANGQITRYMSSPTGTDKWHHDSAYTGAIQKAQSFVWDREMGLMDVMNTPVVIRPPMRESILM